LKTINRLYFKDVASHRDYVILRILADSADPLGSWILKEKLNKYEIEASIASIGRFLKDLDQKGYTELIKNQGRKISAKGKEYLNLLDEDINRYMSEKELIDASMPNTFQEFMELLYARKVIEVETAKLASMYATKEDIEKLEQAILMHHDHIIQNDEDCTEIGCKFHELVGQASHNRFLCSTLKLLIHEEIEMEKKFPYPSTPSQGRHYIDDHQEILEAIKDRQTEKVVMLMEEHMSELIEEIKLSLN
jgi:DNA-binding FadR family transcriptional regulator